MADIKFNCQFCNQSLEAPDDMTGQLTECPKCKKTIQIPTLKAEKPNLEADTSVIQAGGDVTNDSTRLCPFCGEQILSDAKKCKHCKEFLEPNLRKQVPNSTPITTETSGMAVVSMVIGIIAIAGGWFWSGPILPILALVFGHISLSKIKKRAPMLTGKGFAVVGLTLGYISLVIALVAGIIVGSALSSFDQALKKIQSPPIHHR